MRLDELTGVKKYRTRPLDDVLRDFERAGGKWVGGKFGTVLSHPRWDHVYKFFAYDPCYLSFIRWALQNPHPCLPRVLSKPRRIVPFYRRHKSENEIYIVKLEKLNEWKYPSQIDGLGGLERFLETGLYPDSKLSPQVQDLFDQHPELRALVAFYPVLVSAPVSCEMDMHKGNIMQRDDGSLVYTDPFWRGETIYALVDRQKRELTDIEDTRPDSHYVDGGKKWEAKRPPKPTPPSFDDIPF